MKLSRIFLWAACVAVGFTLIAGRSNAQGYLRTITFDGPPHVPPGTDIGVGYYYEDSMTFTPIQTGGQFGRMGGGRDAFPQNGTAYLILAFGDTLAGYRTQLPTPSHFGLSSVDLAEFSTLYNFPATIQFFGYRADGSTVTTSFTTDGIIDGTGPLADFQTFYFGQEFADIVRFEVPGNTYSLDNLVFFDVVPEPTTGALFLLGAGALWLMRAGKRKGSIPSNDTNSPPKK